MDFENFMIHAEPYIYKAYCKCGQKLEQVPNGMASVAMFCPDCESVYVLKLIKLPSKKITEEFLDHCRKRTVRNKYV